jgi:hypothetical protein
LGTRETSTSIITETQAEKSCKVTTTLIGTTSRSLLRQRKIEPLNDNRLINPFIGHLPLIRML